MWGGGSTVELRLLGRFDVVVRGEALALGGPRQRAVLAVLTVHANEIVSTDRLVEDVWGGQAPPTAVVTLQRYISHLRRALDGLPVAVETRRPGYVLVVDPDCIDARRFQRLVEEGGRRLSSGAVDQAATVLRTALALWQGEPLADFCYEEFARVETTRLEELRWSALELRIDADLACGRHRDLVPELEALIAEHPLREACRGQLMRALHGAGRRADALRVYTEGRHVLADELGLDPSTGLQRLEQAILLHDPSVEAPAPARASTTVGRLPAELTSFVGRSSEVQDVATLLTLSRLVTLTGVGGSGKSRLALRVATTLAGSFPSGAWLVELGGVLDPALVPRAVGRALGVREEPDRDVVDALVEALQQQQQECIVVLDGVEHLLDAVAPLVAHVLSQTTGVRILVTSREILDVAGETAFHVPTLPVPEPESDVGTIDAVARFDSVRLFLERARSADATARLTDDDAPALAEVCRRLDGLPLALELAAARTDVLTLRQLADRLDDRFELLSGGRRTAPPRHRTLRATIGWSYDLLDESERLLFDRLSVFSGSFTVETVEAVCGGDGLDPSEVFNCLTRLVRQSLVVRVHAPGPTARYRLLDTLREYARECLGRRGGGEAVQRRHAESFTALIERVAPALRGHDAVRVLDELETEHVEFRSALAWLLDRGEGDAACRLAVALSPFWDYRYHIRDGGGWLERAIEVAARSNGAPSPEQLWATIEAAYFSYKRDDFGGSTRRAEQALELLRSMPDAAAEARVLNVRGEVARAGGDLEVAEQVSGRAAALYHGIGDAWGEADAFRVLSLVYLDRGDISAGEVAATQCFRLYQGVGDIEKTAGAQTLVATFARNRGHLSRAAELYEESLGRFQQIGEPLGLGISLWCLATVAAMQGDYDACGRFGRQCLRVFQDVEFPRGIGQGYQVLAVATLGRGEPAQAERLVASALARFRNGGFTADLVLGLATAARVFLAKDELDEALRYCDEALVHARARGYRRDTGRLLCLRASVLVRLGRVPEAGADAAEAVALFSDSGDAQSTATALVALADVAVAEGRHASAREHLCEARAVMAERDAALAFDEANEFARVSDALDAAAGRNDGEPVGVGTSRARNHR